MADLGTFEKSCYYFGTNFTYVWDLAYKQCVDLGGRLAVIETRAEFLWIMQMLTANDSSLGGLYVDATRGRYGNSNFSAAWRGGKALSEGPGELFNNLNLTFGTIATVVCSSDCVYNNILYKPAFYLSQSGDLVDLEEWNTIPGGNGGYLCKKNRSAPRPSFDGYNIGYCFPELQSNGSCPTGWMQFAPNGAQFCYKAFVSSFGVVDESFRLCHAIGADLLYIDSSAELWWLVQKSGLVANNLLYNYRIDLNAHRLRYGPTFSWSNGQPVANSVEGLLEMRTDLYCPQQLCKFEIENCAYLLGQSAVWQPSSTPCLSAQPALGTGDTSTKYAVCKRPLCGMHIRFSCSQNAWHSKF